MQAKVFAWHLLTRFRVELSFPNAYDLDFKPMPMPKDKLQSFFAPLNSGPVFARRHGLAVMGRVCDRIRQAS